VGIHPANTYRIVRACRTRNEYAEQIRAVSKARVGTQLGRKDYNRYENSRQDLPEFAAAF